MDSAPVGWQLDVRAGVNKCRERQVGCGCIGSLCDTPSDSKASFLSVPLAFASAVLIHSLKLTPSRSIWLASFHRGRNRSALPRRCIHHPASASPLSRSASKATSTCSCCARSEIQRGVWLPLVVPVATTATRSPHSCATESASNSPSGEHHRLTFEQQALCQVQPVRAPGNLQVAPVALHHSFVPDGQPPDATLNEPGNDDPLR